jgi:hypothetical protein
MGMSLLILWRNNARIICQHGANNTGQINAFHLSTLTNNQLGVKEDSRKIENGTKMIKRKKKQQREWKKNRFNEF